MWAWGAGGGEEGVPKALDPALEISVRHGQRFILYRHESSI